MKRKYIVGVIIAIVLAGFVGVYIGNQTASTDGTDDAEEAETTENNSDEGNADEDKNAGDDLEKVEKAFHLIQDNYLEGAEDEQLMEGAIKGMVKSLDDPYSAYMDAETMSQFNQSIESSFEGIGAEVSMVNGNVTIISPIKDSPAEDAGLRPNDQIKSIDGKSTSSLNLQEAVDEIRGEKGSEVVVEIKRPGTSDTFEVTLVRDEIPVETVYSDVKEVDGKKTGILEITSFAEKTGSEFRTQLEELENDGIEGLVLDVRGNPGGILQAVEEILKLFVPEDKPYLQIEDPDGNKEPYFSNLDSKKDYPINILIDEGSASASEILAVALKEIGYDTVGTQSFGKGTVQQPIEIDEDGDTIKLTYFKWLSPDGNWIHDEGVEPTIEVEQPEYYFTNPVEIDEEFEVDDTDDAIGNAQTMLEGLGYDPGRTDGYFNEKTGEAVNSFQKDAEELEATGKLDEATASAIENQIVEKVREGDDDRQMEKALDSLYE